MAHTPLTGQPVSTSPFARTERTPAQVPPAPLPPQARRIVDDELTPALTRATPLGELVAAGLRKCGRFTPELCDRFAAPLHYVTESARAYSSANQEEDIHL